MCQASVRITMKFNSTEPASLSLVHWPGLFPSTRRNITMDWEARIQCFEMLLFPNS